MAEAPLSSQGAESGVVVEFVPSTSLPSVPGGVRTVALLGKGKTTKTVLSHTVTKGSADSADTLTPAAASLPAFIVDENFASYALGIDYQLTSGNVDWSLNGTASFTSTVDSTSPLALNTLTFIVTPNGGSPLTTTFVGTISQSAILTQLNATTGWSGVLLATASGNFIKVATVATNNATLLIGNGTANSVLGFTGGALAVGPKEPAPGVKYTLDYQTNKLTADYTPKTFFDLQSMIDEYGDVNTTNTLSLGAQIVFENSANTGAIVAIQLDPADAPDLLGYQNALNKLASVEGINIVVPLTGDNNLYAAVKAHVVNASAPLEKKERTAILGMQGSVTLSQAQSYASGLAAGGNGRRLMLLWPPSATALVAGVDTTLNGSYLAAAVAGLRINANFDVAEPLLRKQLNGFESVQTNLLRTQKLTLRNSGVTVIENQDGIIRVMEDTTVDRSTADSQEYTVTEIIDFVAGTTRKLIDAIFIGIKLLPDTPNLIAATLNVILSTYVDLQVINGFNNVKASVNTIDPRQIDISFQIQPTFPLRFIKITFSI